MRFHEIIIEGYADVSKKFKTIADPNLVDELIDQYRVLVDKNQVSGNERNIDWWGKQGWDAFEQFMDKQSQQTTSTQRKRKQAAGQSVTLIDNEDIFAVVPLDRDSSCFHGRDTKWCTAVADRFYFSDYFHSDELVLVYFFLKDTGEKYAAAVSPEDPEDAEFFDENDTSISESKFKANVGFNTLEIIELLEQHPSAIQQIYDEKNRIKELTASISKRIAIRLKNNASYHDPELEKDLIDAAEYTYSFYYAKQLYNIIGKTNYPTEFKRLLLGTHNASGIQFIKNVSQRDVKFAIEHEPTILEKINTVPEFSHLSQFVTPELITSLIN